MVTHMVQHEGILPSLDTHDSLLVYYNRCDNRMLSRLQLLLSERRIDDWLLDRSGHRIASSRGSSFDRNVWMALVPSTIPNVEGTTS